VHCLLALLRAAFLRLPRENVERHPGMFEDEFDVDDAYDFDPEAEEYYEGPNPDTDSDESVDTELPPPPRPERYTMTPHGPLDHGMQFTLGPWLRGGGLLLEVVPDDRFPPECEALAEEAEDSLEELLGIPGTSGTIMGILEKRFLKKARLLMSEIRSRMRHGISKRRRTRLTRDLAVCEAQTARIETCIDRAWANWTRRTGITRESCENPPLYYGPIEAPQRKSTCSLLGCRSVCVCAPVEREDARDDSDFGDARSCATAISNFNAAATTGTPRESVGNSLPRTTTSTTTGKDTCCSIGSRAGGEGTSVSPGHTGEQELLFEPQPNLGLGANTHPSRGAVISAEATICVPVEGKNVEEKTAESDRENAPQRLGKHAAKKAKRAAAAAAAASATLPPCA